MSFELDTNLEPKVRVSDLPEFVDFCDRQNLAVLGMEGGLLSDEGFFPDLNLIADFSFQDNIGWVEYKEKCNKGVFLFLKAVDCSKETVFVMTIINENDFNELKNRNPFI